jgi:hypothetical protein
MFRTGFCLNTFGEPEEEYQRLENQQKREH